jgi:hypothetical protein
VRCPDTRLSLTALGSIYGRVTTQLTGQWSLCSDQTCSVVCGLLTVLLKRLNKAYTVIRSTVFLEQIWNPIVNLGCEYACVQPIYGRSHERNLVFMHNRMIVSKKLGSCPHTSTLGATAVSTHRGPASLSSFFVVSGVVLEVCRRTRSTEAPHSGVCA